MSHFAGSPTLSTTEESMLPPDNTTVLRFRVDALQSKVEQIRLKASEVSEAAMRAVRAAMKAVGILRWVPLLNPKLDPARVSFIGMDHEPAKGENGWYYAWLAGTPYSCIRVERWGWRAWLGWKLKPEDRTGLQPADVRAIRCDFACQIKRVAHG